jgi:hypothetical protein
MIKRIGISLIIFVIGMASLRLVAQDVTPDAATLLAERNVTMMPLEAVTQSAVQILDIGSDSARLNFVGTVPLACTVVFGTTTAFGNAAIDTNMNGGAIIEHNPVMSGLQPDTDYYYRVEGSGQDGTFYVGTVGMFHTLPKSNALVANLLSPERGAQVIGVSSNYGGQPNNGSFGILNAFDDNPNTEWSSNGDGDHAWFEVRLGTPTHVTQIATRSREMSDGTAEILSFTVTADDGKVYGPFKLPDAAQSYTFAVDFEATTLRFDTVSSSGGNTGVRDFAVYGEAIPAT